MHHNVREQIRIGGLMHDAYLEYINDKTDANYQNYIQLKDKMKEYSPDPSARF